MTEVSGQQGAAADQSGRVAEYRTSEQRLYHLAHVVEQIAAVRDWPALMAIVCRAARELTGADGATLVLRDGDQCHYVDEDAIGPLWKGQRFPLTACISGWAMRHAEAVDIPDIDADPRIPHAAYRSTFVRSLTMVPVGRHDPVAAIGCYWADRHRSTPEELRLQQALADATAVGVANVELYRRLENAASEARDSEARFRATFEQAAVGIAHVAPDGRWLRVNAKLCDIVGYRRDELLAQTFQDITHPDDLPGDYRVLARLLAREVETETLEKRYLHKSGRQVWINLTVSVIRHPDGTPDYFIAVVQDIQRRKAAEAELAESRQIFQSLAEIASDYFWALDDQFRLCEISSSVASHSKLDYRRYLGKTRWEMPCVGVADSVWESHRAALAAHLPFRKLELGLVDTEGQLRWFVISGDPVFGADGVFKGYRGVTQDVTERRQWEEKLRQQAAVFSVAQEGIVITDVRGTVLAVNPAFTTITEYTADEVVGTNMNLLKSGHHEPSFYDGMWQSLRTRGAWQGEVWNRRKSGQVFLEWVTINAVRDAAGQVVNFVGVQTDVTRMKHSETELERLAQYDVLTGLPNRMLLGSRLRHALERAQRHRHPVAVLFIDLDRFKPVNDTFGHAIGDKLLQAVARCLDERLRESDTLSRLGGDEFVVVLDELDSADGAAKVAGDLLAALQRPFDLADGVCVQVGASIGVALAPEHGMTPEELLDRADRALYQSKHAGRGVFSFFQTMH